MSKKNKLNTNHSQVEINQKPETNYYDIISLIFLTCLLASDFLPLFGSVEIIGPKFLYLSIINFAIGLYIYRNPSLISEKLISLCKNNFILKIYFLFILLCGISIFNAQNTSLAIVSFSRIIIILFTSLNLIVLFYNRLHLIYKIGIIISISLFIDSFNEISDFVKLLKTESLVMALQHLKGNTGNINIFASSLSIKIPFLLIGIIHIKKWLKWFLVFTLFLATFLIFLSGSRATYFSLFLEVIIFSFIYIKLNSEKKVSFFKISYIIIPIILSFFISNQIFKASKAKGRYESVTNRVKQATNIESSSKNIRLLYWQNALEMIKKKPLTGIGLGNWRIESIPYEKVISKNRIISKNAHNDFVEIMTETGVLNGILYLSLFLFLVVINLKIVLKSKNQELNTVALVSLLIIVSYFVDASFNFPFYRPIMQLGFCIFFALTILNMQTNEESNTSRFSNKYAILLIFISVITTYFSFKIFKTFQLENNIRSNFITNNFSLKANEIVSNLPEYPNVFTSGEPFATYAGKYFILEKNYDQAIKYLNMGDKINPYIGRTEFYKAIIAKETGKKDSASFYSKKALEIKPRVKDYYVQAINLAVDINDTIGILKIHKIYTEHDDSPEIWINTSSALNISKYQNKKLIEFMNEGLKKFPGNPLLLERKKLFQNFSKINKSVFYIKQANAFYKESKYEKALQSLKQALKEDPTNPTIMQNIKICNSTIEKSRGN